MNLVQRLYRSYQIGEAKRRQPAVKTLALQIMAVDTLCSRIFVQWDHGASATSKAELTFLAENNNLKKSLTEEYG